MSMTVGEFTRVVRSRGPEVDLWLVYEEDRNESIVGEALALVLKAAFWKRGEAYAHAARAHGERESRHYYVFRLTADGPWASSGMARPLEFEAVFDDAREIPSLAVTAAQVAQALSE